MNIKIRYKLWIEVNSSPLLGSGGVKLLQLIDRYKSIKYASKEIGVSYAFAWRYVKRLETILGKTIVKRWRGGSKHGGAELTDLGREVVKLMHSLQKEVEGLVNKYEDELKSLLQGG